MSKRNLWIISLVTMILFAVAVAIGIVLMIIQGEAAGAGFIVFIFALPMLITALFLFLYCKRDTFKRLYINYICSPFMIGAFSLLIPLTVLYGRGADIGYLLGIIVSAILFSILAVVFFFNIISTIVKNYKAKKKPSEAQPTESKPAFEN